MKEHIYQERHDDCGYFCEYRFPNGYGAVVVQNKATYGYVQGYFEVVHTVWEEGKDWEYAGYLMFDGERDFKGWVQMLDIPKILQTIANLPIDKR